MLARINYVSTYSTINAHGKTEPKICRKEVQELNSDSVINQHSTGVVNLSAGNSFIVAAPSVENTATLSIKLHNHIVNLSG